ncbi:S8 family serine peptidase [Streptomyces durbertensis]|uniref:S8 family serine peptidase n=2 Tax=Streptomyces durbertensis TaxID=2448886 RepID=A0ABR6EI27_9ACTN|nr:S8 family serine peptidase [Streptomyces durbertensis]
MALISRSKQSARQLLSTLLGTTLLLLLLPITPAAAASVRDQQWYLDAMRAEEMWKVSKGAGVTVAVLDAGVDPNVPELRGQVLPGTNVISRDRPAHSDDIGHGTTIAGVIAGTGAGNGLRGLAPEAKILPVTVVEKSDEPRFFEGLDSVAEAIDYAVDNGAKIINCSFGSSYDQPSTQKAIDRANRKGVLIFAGAGNFGKEQRRGKSGHQYPARLPGVVAVGATDKQAKHMELSSYGPHIALTGPGDVTPQRCDGTQRICIQQGGTSVATAVVSASAALIWSKHPDWTANQVLRVMIKTAGRPEADKDLPRSHLIGFGGVRPRMVLLEGEGDPGDPDTNPLFAKRYAERSASASPVSPTPSASPSAESPAPAEDTAAPDSSTGATVTVAAGVGVLVLVGAAVATVIVRGRRRRAG